VLVHQLRHFEHVDGRLAAEHRLQSVVRLDHPPVLLVLQTVLLDVGPELLGDVGARPPFLALLAVFALLALFAVFALFALFADFAVLAFFALAICSPIE
jgi:hypothetical protein